MIGAAEIRNARILVVDDSAVNVTLLVRILEAAGYTGVTSTTRSTEVCALYAAERHDLILLDLMMPEMDGFEVLEELHKIETEGYLPVVVLTAQPKHRMRALLGGARDFITKPFDQAEVLARIRNVLESRLLLLESRSHEQLLQQYDQLTGLPNRRRYRELLIKALARPETKGGQIAVLFVDIDHFQSVNDVLGRTIGGVMLATVADRLLACLSPMSTLARLEGSRFGVILVLDALEPGAPPHEAAESVAQRLRDTLRVPIAVDGHELVAELSIGVALSPGDATDADGLLTCAARALSDAAAAGGDTIRFHSDATNREASDALALATALRGALEREEFTLVYQPKMRIATGEWVSAEALLRWDRPGVGPVSPGSFIRVLEETGLIVPVGSWVLGAVCRQIAAWERDGLGWIRVAVNVSSRQFALKGFVAEVAAALEANGVPAFALDLEITEGSLMSRAAETRNTLLELKALGVKLAIDDFGTGYSSLSYLQRYPVDTLKLDISFVRGITTAPDDAAIAIAIIQMARVLRLTVVAEGVETPEQLEFLSVHACDEIQGYLFSRPLPATELARLRRASPIPGRGAPVVAGAASPSDGLVPSSLP